MNININVHVKKQRKENLIHAFTVDPLTHNGRKNLLRVKVLLIGWYFRS